MYLIRKSITEICIKKLKNCFNNSDNKSLYYRVNIYKKKKTEKLKFIIQRKVNWVRADCIILMSYRF